MAFLLAFFLHSQHISKPQSEQGAVDEYQDCHICQQGVDSPPKPVRLTPVARDSFSVEIFRYIVSIDTTSAYVIPQLRAPPFFQ